MQIELLIASILRLTTPILLCAIGSQYCDRSGVTNIALEGLMLLGAFMGVLGSYFTGSWVLGIIIAIASCIIAAMFFGLITLKLGGTELVVGFAMNVLLSSLTVYMLRSIFHVSGSIVSDRIIGIPKSSIPGLRSIPVLGALFNEQNILVYFAFVSVFLSNFIFKRTHFGLKIISSGENPQAASAVGIDVHKVRLACLIITGVMCGLAGVQLSLGFLSLFTENMTSGRGFIALMAVVYSNGKPFRVLLVALLFGTAEMLSNQLQLLQLPSYLILMLPYVCVIVLTLIRIPRSNRRIQVKIED